jgi:hypothetical protein
MDLQKQSGSEMLADALRAEHHDSGDVGRGSLEDVIRKLPPSFIEAVVATFFTLRSDAANNPPGDVANGQFENERLVRKETVGRLADPSINVMIDLLAAAGAVVPGIDH